MPAKVWTIFRKDLLIELRTKDSLNAMIFFGIVVLVIFNFALEGIRESIRAAVPGVLWVSFAFSGTLGLNRMFAAEKENSCGSLGNISRGATFKNISHMEKYDGRFKAIFDAIRELMMPPVRRGRQIGFVRSHGRTEKKR